MTSVRMLFTTVFKGQNSLLEFWFCIDWDLFFALPKQTDIDSLFVDLRVEAPYLKENFHIQWVSEAGIIENIEQITEEYRQNRGLPVW